MKIITNTTAKNAFNAQQSLQKSISKISSGLRIDQNKDDLAGMNFSSALEKDATSLDMATKNTTMAINFLMVVNHVYEQQYDMLVRGREMAVQNSTETYDSDQLVFNNNEFADLFTESTGQFDILSQRATFNNQQVMNTGASDYTFQIGIDNNASNKLTFDPGEFASVIKSSLTMRTASIEGIGTHEQASQALDGIDDMMDIVSLKMAKVGSLINKLEHTLDNNTAIHESLTLSAHKITDVDMALETSRMTRDQIKFNASSAALGQAKGMKPSTISLIGLK